MNTADRIRTISERAVWRVRREPYTCAGAIAIVLLFAGDARAQATATPPVTREKDASKPTEGAGARKPFVQTIKGTTVSFTMAPIPGGTAPDGTAIKPFSIATTEVTWDVYDIWVFSLDVPEGTADASTRPTKPYLLMDRGYGHQGYPAISVSHKGAEEFCRWLTAKTGRKYRLPTEAEWEHACRAGASGKYGFGDDAAELREHAWYAGNAEEKTHPIGTRKANAWGLFDMLGNASEWVTGADGAPKTAGGCFRDEAEDLTPATRVAPSRSWNASDPQIPKSVWWLADGGFVGFRVVCEGGSDEVTK